MRKFIVVGTLVVGIIGSTAASCDKPKNGQLPSSSHGAGIVPDNGSVIGRMKFTVGGVTKYYVHVKTDNIPNLAMQVTAADYARCTVGKVFPECEKP